MLLDLPYYYSSTIVAFLYRIFYANCPRGEICQTLKMLYSRNFRAKYYTKPYLEYITQWA